MSKVEEYFDSEEDQYMEVWAASLRKRTYLLDVMAELESSKKPATVANTFGKDDPYSQEVIEELDDDFSYTENGLEDKKEFKQHFGMASALTKELGHLDVWKEANKPTYLYSEFTEEDAEEVREILSNP
ncbi:MAG: hypothetical protein ABEJ95_04605 [Candidatus Nanohalobium sp.]